MVSAAAIHEAIRVLGVEREALHARRAGHAELEANRLELVRLRQELARAVVAFCRAR